MRVLMISKALVAGIYQRKLEGIAAQDVDLLALTPPEWRDERGVQPLERAYTNGYRLETLPIWLNGSYHLHVYPTLARQMRAFRPHIVHIDEEPYNLASWAALAAAKRVGAQTLFFTWQNICRAYPIPFRWGERWMLREVRQAIAGTESAAQVLRDKGYTGDVAVIAQFGIDPDLFRPAEARPDRPFTVGCAARLVPEKGVDLLLRAVARMDGVTAVRIIGGGPQRQELEALAGSLSLGARVTFVEQVPSMAMPGQYHQFDVLAAPSRTTPTWKEQFGPRAGVEAMASGVPVVGSDSGAIPGVVGEGGLIVPEGDVEALTVALCRLRDDAALRAEIGRRGRARALTHYTHEQVARATVAVYQSMLD
ncbi:MAG: glycosyltransferase family 4 protein [Anaerolineae bacterium]|nr:glycosyltransferase family 4 protein [Anaerolineae bacterium]NUQ04700.1 glycosyltransferase family 4 protein [Anaerolineae bacterium]